MNAYLTASLNSGQQKGWTDRRARLTAAPYHREECLTIPLIRGAR